MVGDQRAIGYEFAVDDQCAVGDEFTVDDNSSEATSPEPITGLPFRRVARVQVRKKQATICRAP
ncbi:hypothetical protein, partial [Achromobacter marplatensis]|uniref:hypothetical protein n=1 Tax=Achromobacter marplatensis TaxID=470868 RepID=UPI0039F6B112